MTDRPILFSAPMVRALLDGRKSQTRRILTRNNTEVLGASWRGKSCPWEGLRFGEAVARENSPISGTRDPHLAVPFCHPTDEPTPTADCGVHHVRPIIEAGDRLWVRENFWIVEVEGGGIGEPFLVYDEEWSTGPGAKYPRPTETRDGFGMGSFGHHPSIHMPRVASRLTLTVTDVRVRRLQEISEADAKAEGADHAILSDERKAWFDRLKPWPDFYRPLFAGLWNDISGAGAWAANPWICATSFTVDKRNIDAEPYRYLIWSRYHGAWWGPNKAGYTTVLERAGRYTREQAIAQCATGRDGYTHGRMAPEIPIREIDALNANGRGPNELLLPADHRECRARDLARKPKAAA